MVFVHQSKEQFYQEHLLSFIFTLIFELTTLMVVPAYICRWCEATELQSERVHLRLLVKFSILVITGCVLSGQAVNE